MTDYNDHYYIAFQQGAENDILFLSALQKTADRRYSYKKMVFGQEPLFFENSYKEEDKKTGIQHPISKVHMNGNYLIVDDQIKQLIDQFDIDNFQLYPAVIIGDDGEYHEQFWFFNIYGKLDCVDFEKSTVEDYDPTDKRHDVEKYFLDSDVLDKIPEEQRLIFRPEKTGDGFTFVHQRIVDIFEACGVVTVKFFKVSEWEMGMQF